MATDRMALVDVLRKGEDPEADFLKEGVRWLIRELIEAEVSAQIGAERYERSDERTTQRNGYRTRRWDTRVGTLEVAIPKLRAGTYFPSWLEARRRGEQALVAVVAEAYVQGVSTRKVDALVQTLGITGISKSEVSRLCAALDAQTEAFRTRRLDAEYPYVWFDARYEHIREDNRVQSMAVVVAYGVRADGVREVLGLDVGLSEDVVLWRAFMQGLVARGLRGVKLVISDAHVGLKHAIKEVFLGASWQRCRVHFMRNILARVPKSAQAMVAATVRTIFEQPDRAAAESQLLQVVEALQDRFPVVVQLLLDAEGEVLAFYDFPPEHRRQIASTNPLERLNKELKRRSAVVGIFPNRGAVTPRTILPNCWERSASPSPARICGLPMARGVDGRARGEARSQGQREEIPRRRDGTTTPDDAAA